MRLQTAALVRRWAARPEPPRSLRWRLAILVAIFACAVLFAVAAAQYLLLQRYLMARTEQTLRASARPALAAAAASPDAAIAASQLAVELGNPGLAVAVVGADGTRLAAAGGPPRDPEPLRRQVGGPALRRALVDRAEGPMLFEAGPPRRAVVVLPVELGPARVRGAVQLSAAMGEVDGTLNRLLLLDAVGLGALVLVLGGGSALIVARTLRPLDRLAAVADALGGGDMARRSALPHDGSSEIGRLARAFDAMAGRLEQLFAQQRQFLADASHELKTPLTALRGSLDVLLLGMAAGPDEQNRLLLGMHRQATRMSRLVAELLALARGDAGLGLAARPVDLGAIARDVAAEAGPLLDGHKFRLELPDAPVLARVDPDRVQQIALALVDNAVRHTPPSEIRLVVERAGARARLLVADRGPGIAATDLPHVFDRFYRGSSSRARAADDAGGFGLGLSIARELARAQGGELQVESREGDGATFALDLPVAGAEADAPPAAAS